MNNLLLISTGAVIGICVAVGVLVVAVIGIVIWWISCHNRFVALQNIVEEGWSTIDIQLKKRYDLIPNLVSTVQGYAKHESSTLEAVIRARNAAMTATPEARMEAENVLTGTLKSLFALQEAYPNLKADTGFLDLQRQLTVIENELSAARRYYNGTVKELNIKIDSFPSSIVARRMKLEKRKFFELDAAEERQAPKVTF